MSKKPHKTVITLTVDTENLIADPANKNKYVTFSDNQGDAAETPGEPGDYESTVIKGLTCEWQGVAVNKRDTVNITDVSKKAEGGGEDILEEITLGDPFDEPKVTAKIKNKDIDGFEYYNVTFMINKNESLVYTIDPRLKMKLGTN
jgi:hypothetical protein